MATARETVERHAKAAVEGKMDVVAGDVIPELMPSLGPLAEQLAKIQPTGYEILSETKVGDIVVFEVKYIGKKGILSIRSKWSLIGKAWKVVEAAPI